MYSHTQKIAIQKMLVFFYTQKKYYNHAKKLLVFLPYKIAIHFSHTKNYYVFSHTKKLPYKKNVSVFLHTQKNIM